MIDTIYLVTELSVGEFEAVYDKLQLHLKTFFPSQQLRRSKTGKWSTYKTFITNAFWDIGIRKIALKKTQYGYRSIEVLFKPSKLLEREERKGEYLLTKLSDFEDIEIGFDYVIRDILSLPVPSFKQWKTKRIDMAVDVFVGEMVIDKYIQLFKKGNIPDYFFDNLATRLYWHSSTNLYLCATKFVLNWYDRYATLREKEKKSRKKYADYSETKGILRIEVQLRQCDQPLYMMLDQEIIRKQIIQHYSLLIGAGNYYSLENAIEIITDRVANKNKREELVQFLSLVNQYGSIFEAKKEYSNRSTGVKSPQDKFSKRINQLRKMGINPVVLPPDWKIQMLPNLINDIDAELNKNNVCKIKYGIFEIEKSEMNNEESTYFD